MRDEMRFILTALCVAMAMHMNGYDFMADGIAYNINDDGISVTVTYTNYLNNYPGVQVIDIPERVANGTKEYTVTAIGGYALNECASLATLRIPSTVRYIGEYAVFGAYNLTTLQMGSNVQEIARYAFSEVGLSSLNLPNSVTTIGDYAFAGCNRLATVAVGNGVKQIGRSAFSACQAMIHLSLGPSVETIAVNAFAGNTALNNISCSMAVPPEIQASVFDGVNKTTCHLSVPQGSLQLYKNAPVWQEFVHMNNNTGFEVTANDVEYLRCKKDVMLTIGLNNPIEVSAMSMVVQLPVGVTVALKSGRPNVQTNNSRCTSNHFVEVEGNKILLASSQARPLNGNTGDLLYVYLAVDDTLLVEQQDIRITDVNVSTPTGELIALQDKDVKFDIYYLRSDADGDGSVDVADYVVAANRLLDRETNRYFLDAADVNQNGYLDVADLVGIILRALKRVPVEKVKK